jgi:hypothetical protein
MKITRAQLKKIIKEELSLLNENYNMNEEGDDVPEMKEYSNGTKMWRLNGKLHRTDGPAIERSEGTKLWYLNGKLHRTDGPAIERSDGTKLWYLNGRLHRTDGPVVEWSDGSKAWYLYSDGSKEWWLNGKRHRTDGPAVEYSNGSKEWWLNNKKVTWRKVYDLNVQNGDIQTAKRILGSEPGVVSL